VCVCVCVCVCVFVCVCALCSVLVAVCVHTVSFGAIKFKRVIHVTWMIWVVTMTFRVISDDLGCYYDI
jgi:hypothetical protein